MNLQTLWVASTALFLIETQALAQHRGAVPLVKAAAEGNIAAVEELLKADAGQANAKDNFGRTALHEAIRRGHRHVVEALLNHGLSADTPIPTGATALQFAAQIGNRAMVELLLDRGANPNLAGSSGRDDPPLIRAARRGDTAVMQLLLDHVALVDATDRAEYTALMAAAAAGHLEAVQLLVAHKANLDARAHSSETAFERALRSGHRQVAEFLLLQGATPDAWLGLPQLTSDELKNEAIVNRRIDEVVDIVTGFHAACASGDKARVSRCLERCPALVNVQDLQGRKSPLELAVAGGWAQAVEILLEHGADTTRTHGTEGGIVNQAVKRRSLDVVKLLLVRTVDANLVSLTAERTLLAEAVLVGDKEIASYLLDQGADVNAVSWPDSTALCFATDRDDQEMVRLLLDRNADPNFRGHRKISPLHIAAEHGNREIVELLLSCGADLSLRDRYGDTPLQAAANAKRKDLTDLFMKNGAEVTIAAWVSLGDLERVRTELENDPTLIGKQNDVGRTLLHLAAESGNREMTEMLLSYKAKPDAYDEQGETPLHLAARKEDLRVATALLNHEADANARDNQGETPFDTTHAPAMQELLAHHGGHTSQEVWPGETRRGPDKRAIFAGNSITVRDYQIFSGGHYRFVSPLYSLLLRNVDGALYSECVLTAENRQEKITIDPAKNGAVTLVETTDGKSKETSYKDLNALELQAPELIERYRKLRQQHDQRQIEGEWSVRGPATMGGPGTIQ